ncbi:MAG: preprotein translocase subunit SecG [Puniceicoccales bacterium]|jgi:preprotein translocase subunit SecG|nr:preprotein translocase subunit SecG [Puniceicoccales bacterium]
MRLAFAKGFKFSCLWALHRHGASVYTFLIFFLTFVLVCASGFIVLIILMQRPSSNAGLGSALGSGIAESAFGGETTKVLTKWTIYGIVVFFIAAMLLAMAYVARKNHSVNEGELPVFVKAIQG